MLREIFAETQIVEQNSLPRLYTEQCPCLFILCVILFLTIAMTQKILLCWVRWLLGSAHIQCYPESFSSISLCTCSFSVCSYSSFCCSIFCFTSLFQPSGFSSFSAPTSRGILCYKTQAIGCGHICSVSLALQWQSRTEFLSKRSDYNFFSLNVYIVACLCVQVDFEIKSTIILFNKI